MRKEINPLKNKQQNSEVLSNIGPVENLESYVKADWWRDIFNANYLRTDGDVVADESITRTEVDLFSKLLSPSKDSCILDLCCGQGRHLMEFASRGFSNLYGLDRSHYLINKARSVNRDKRYSIFFKEGDARKLGFQADMFDYVIIAGNSFGYFESVNEDSKVLLEVMRVLKPKGKLLIDVTDGNFVKNHFKPRSWEWIDRNYFVCRERSLSSDQDRLISREVITHVKKGVVADQFYAERLYSKENISSLIQNAGFKEVSVHQPLSPDSKRMQDLGMMEKRIVISAIAEKSWTPKKQTGKIERKVAVLLGDHRIPDIVKPNASFDEDDFFTINELKRALSSLKGYQFTYFNNHKTMINELLKKHQKFDYALNLCDEGFDNDPTKELHVPTFLELLNVPYSGGTPQCLAYCYDKSLVRGIAKELDIPVPNAFVITPEVTNFIELQLEFPVIVKPNFGDSSFGITRESVCYSPEELQKALMFVHKNFGYNKPVLVESYLTGKDITIGIIGNPPEAYLELPIIEEDYSRLPENLPKICGYEAKWDPTSPYATLSSIPANLPRETETFLFASCIKLFERLECRDYARFDWRLDENETPRLLEVNPNPGWCWDGHLAKMSKLAGYDYIAMLQYILKAAEERIAKNVKPESMRAEKAV